MGERAVVKAERVSKGGWRGAWECARAIFEGHWQRCVQAARSREG